MPVISVIVPVYNVEEYVRRCIESVLSQSFTEYEIILVDDGSPDKSPQICEEYAKKDTRIHVVHKENGGLSSARNAGIDVAKGDYLFFLDSDDLIHPDCLSILYKCLEKTGAEISLGEFNRFDEYSQNYISHEEWNEVIDCKNNVEILELFFEESKPIHKIVSACGTLWSASLFDDIRFPIGRLFEDEFTTYQLYYKANKIAITDYICYYYFINHNGITGTLNLEKRFDEYEAQWQRLNYLDEKGLKSLVGKAALHYLKTAQWDLIELRKNKIEIEQSKIKAFEKRYRDVYQIAKEIGVIQFLRDYDYCLLAYPNLKMIWRIKRKLLMLKKSEHH